MSTEVKPPLRVIEAVKIKRIRLVEASVKTKIRSTKEAPPLDINYVWFAQVKGRDKDGSFRIQPTMEVRVSPRGTKKNPVIIVRVAFELTYGLPKGFAVTRRELDAFAQTNGVFNAWPYWRELIQNMFARMDLPQPALPLYRIPKPAEGKAKENSKKKSSA